MTTDTGQQPAMARISRPTNSASTSTARPTSSTSSSPSILAVITALEVTLSYVDVGAMFLPALLILMAAKFLIVVSYFMHLKFDNRMFSFLFYMGLVLAVFVYIVALATFHFFGS